ncbi:hypothetical protein [Bacillus sp. FJAT-27445]|uniref:hypothetical protein n=1 Tax=Bacillus sp. FJAT-27445 TaxID=1679166 RepID=UPI0007439D6A|nr:hypothetical protein [Bacillus sp. FJAT-27445]
MLYIIIVCVLLIAVCLYLVLHPLFAGAKDFQEAAIDQGLTMETVYEAVNELEMDVLMKKISSEDFQNLKESYYRLASDSIRGNSSVDRDIQEALELIRAEAKEDIYRVPPEES